MDLEELNKRLQYFEDLEAIKTLKFRYAEAVNEKANPEEMSKLFTENGIWDGGENLGRQVGREDIKKFCQQLRQAEDFAVHHFVQPNISIQGNKAQGRWYMWIVVRMNGSETKWESAIEDEKYEKVNGKWLIAELKLKNERTGTLLQDETPKLR